jgi:putative glutamine amidotransferase
MTTQPRIAIPIPTTSDLEYNQRSWPNYAEAVRQSGGEPVEIPLTITRKDLSALFGTCLGVVLPGSPADVDPARYGQDPIPECAPADLSRETVDLFLLEEAYRQQKPILAICFGTQILNVWRGGTLIQDLAPIPVNHGAGRSVAIAHTAAIAPDSRLGAILLAQPIPPALEAPEQDGFLRLPINSSHHQAIGIPGDGLRISARCSQDAVIEAVESDTPGHFVLAVQWHPERSYAESHASAALFTCLVREAAAVPALA